MTKFIKLTQFAYSRYAEVTFVKHGQPVYINVAHIVELQAIHTPVIKTQEDLKLLYKDRDWEWYTCITYAFLTAGEDSNTIMVQETPEQIFRIIAMTDEIKWNENAQ